MAAAPPPARYLTPAEIAGAAALGGFRIGDELTNAVAIALAESGGNTNALNEKPPDLSYGLWQINMYGDKGPARRKQFNIKDDRQLFDPSFNAMIAKKIRDGQGWEAWSTFKNGAYLKYMDQAKSANSHGVLPTNPDGTPVIQGGFAGGDPISNFLKSLGPFVLRLSGFIGGGALVIIGIVLYVVKTQGSTVKKLIP